MQLIYTTFESVEEYQSRQTHARLSGPRACPNCGRPARLHSHGTYQRYTTSSGPGTPKISIRRFCCPACRRTVSLLPSFAQPYRLVLNDTIDAWASGERSRADVRRWTMRIKHYWNQYRRWLPIFRLKVSGFLSARRHHTPEAVWNEVLRRTGSLAAATAHLTERYQVTMFGEYKCHLPNPP